MLMNLKMQINNKSNFVKKRTYITPLLEKDEHSRNFQ